MGDFLSDKSVKGVVTKIRQLSPEEKSSGKHADKIQWVQLCPFCGAWVGSLVDHIKSAHKDENHKMIRTKCPFEECAKMVVDIKNHINMVHYKIKNFSCGECESAFTSNNQLVKHVEAVHDNIKVNCEECGAEFKSTTLKSHIRRVHRGIKPSVPCTDPSCKKVFGSKTDLERHVLGVHMKWKAPCPECGKKIRMESLMVHVRKTHKGMFSIKCEICGQGFQNQKGLETHKRVKHVGSYIYCKASNVTGGECGKILYSEEGLLNHVECKHIVLGSAKTTCTECSVAVYTCYMQHHVTFVHGNHDIMCCVVKYCDMKVKDKSELRLHIDRDHSSLGLEWCYQCELFVLKLTEHKKLQHEADLQFQPVYGVCAGQTCNWEGCEFMASSETHLARHVRSVHKTPMVKCEICGKKVRNIEDHVRSQHLKMKSIPCDHCDRLFLTTAKLNTHIKNLQRVKETCKECGVPVMNMRQHVRFVHEKDLPYECTEPGCSTKFTSNLSLRNHVASVHEKIKDECGICHVLVSNLRKHVKIVHDKVRDHVCPECQKTFQTRTHLKNHVARVHLGLRDECPECGKMVQDLKTHINFVHNKIANFPCNQCSTRCLTSTALKKHLSSVHFKESIGCPKCGVMVAPAYLSQHMRRKHLKEDQPKFSCKHCEKDFVSRGELAKHIMRVHIAVREECNICGLMTKDLKRHNMYTNCGRVGYIPRKMKQESCDIPPTPDVNQKLDENQCVMLESEDSTLNEDKSEPNQNENDSGIDLGNHSIEGGSFLMPSAGFTNMDKSVLWSPSEEFYTYARI